MRKLFKTLAKIIFECSSNRGTSKNFFEKIFVKSCFFGILFVTYMRGKIK